MRRAFGVTSFGGGGTIALGSRTVPGVPARFPATYPRPVSSNSFVAEGLNLCACLLLSGHTKRMLSPSTRLRLAQGKPALSKPGARRMG